MKKNPILSKSYLLPAVFLLLSIVTAIKTNAQVCKLNAQFSFVVDTPKQLTFHDLSTDTTIGATITSWHWDFGDSDTSNQQNPIHIYAIDTTYTVCLTVTNLLGCSNTTCQQVIVNNIHQTCLLTALFNYSADTTGLATFRNLRTDSTIGASITSWYWDFGDTTTSNLKSPTHRFTKGFYTVCLTVTNSLGCTNQFCKQVSINVQGGTCKLNAQFSFVVDTPKQLTFHDLSTDTTVGATIISWHWDFGDSDTSNQQNPIHIYAIDTTYNVCLTVTNSKGCINTVCQQVVVNNTNCMLRADFSYTADTTGLATFTDLSTDSTIGATISSWHWNFGDTTVSTLQNPVHQYSPGTYNVCLTVTNSLGCSNTSCQQVVFNKSNSNCSLIAQFSYATDTSGLTTFTDLSYDSTGRAKADTWYWTFGDSAASFNQNPTHQYSSPGTYTVCLTVASTMPACTSQFCKQITISQNSNCHLTAQFSYNIDTFGLATFHDLSTDTTKGAIINSWHWDFGTSRTSSALQNPTFFYTNDSIYTVCLTVDNSLGCSNTTCQQVVVNKVNPPCHITALFSDIADSTGLTTFHDLSTDSTLGAYISYYQWDFSDGSSSNQQNPVHQYASGTFTACLTVYNSEGCSDKYCNQITIAHGKNCYLNARFSYILNDTTGLATFQDLSTDSTPGATIISWYWSFGNVLQNPTHLYTSDSAYNVCLTVGNSLGCSNTTCQQVVVNRIYPNCKLTAQFSYTTDTTGLGSFMDLSTDSTAGGVINTWHWNFGDLGSPTDDVYTQNATHSFTTSSIYNVCLTTGDSQGCSNTVCKQVTVNAKISSLCVSVFPQDSSLVSQPQNTEFYLIKEFNTANGDSLALIDTFTVTNQINSYHCFTSLPNGTYYAKAEYTPGSSAYQNYFPSYFTAVLLWNNATPININGSQFITLMLIKGTNPGGPSFIGGYVSQGANRLEQGNSVNAVGDPEPGKTVLLTSNLGDAVAHTVTDAQGHYQFNKLPYGTYYLSIDELNKLCTPLEVTIGDSTGYHENANFQVNSKSIVSAIVLSASTISQHPFTLSLLGNPVSDQLKLFTQNMNDDAVITITDLLGRESFTATVAKETELVNLNVQNLASGVYIITINSGTDLKTLKFMKD